MSLNDEIYAALEDSSPGEVSEVWRWELNRLEEEHRIVTFRIKGLGRDYCLVNRPELIYEASRITLAIERINTKFKRLGELMEHGLDREAWEERFRGPL